MLTSNAVSITAFDAWQFILLAVLKERGMAVSMQTFMKIHQWIAVVLLGAGATMGLINVIARYILNRAIIWGDEATLYIFIWMLFFGLSRITYEGAHLKTDFISQYIKSGSSFQRIMAKILNLITVIISLLVTYHGATLMQTAFLNQRYSDSGIFPMALVYASIPVGFLLNAIAGLALVFMREPDVDVGKKV